MTEPTDTSQPPAEDRIQQAVERIYKETRSRALSGTLHETTARARVNPEHFAVAVVTAEGKIYAAGDTSEMFPLQSISKVFTYGMALEDHGRDVLLEHIGVEPTGHSYNAIVLDEKTGRPSNPMVNAGAIVVADLIKGDDLTEKLNRVIETLGRYAGRHLLVDAPTFTYEFQTDHRNRAIAHLMRSSGALTGDIDAVLHLYFQHCSLLVNTIELAQMGATLANGGVQPITGERVLSQSHVRDVLSVMNSCGMYDTSGEWAYRVGLPAKSGISGGILGVVPGQMAIASYSPLLNAVGHSGRGLHVFESLSQALKLHLFDCH